VFELLSIEPVELPAAD